MEVKEDLSFTVICAVCLSEERRLQPIGTHLALYELLVSDDNGSMSVAPVNENTERNSVLFAELLYDLHSEFESSLASTSMAPRSDRKMRKRVREGHRSLAVCWECRAVLRRTANFRKRALRARCVLFSQLLSSPNKAKLQCSSTLCKTITKTYDVCHHNKTKNTTECHRSNEKYATECHHDTRNTTECHQSDTKNTTECHHSDTKNTTECHHEKNARECHHSDTKNSTECHYTDAKNATQIEIKSEICDPFDDAEAPSPISLKEEPQFEPLDDVPLAQTRKEKVRERKKKRGKRLVIVLGKLTDQEKCKVEKSMAATPCSQRYTAVPVTEEQLQRWRGEDARNERYLRLQYKCTSCLVAFNFADQLLQHNARNHNEALGEFSCDVCACRFPSETERLAHRELHVTRYECLHCDYATRDKSDVNKHYVMEHSSLTYNCGQCDAVYKTASQLRYHRDDKHGKRWPCKHCGKTFRLRNNMYSHMLIHKQLPEAPCPICEKVMRNKYSLKIHMKRHEQSNRSWYCRPCDAHFTHESGYKSHLTTSMKHLTPDKLKYGCEECGRRFLTEKRRRRHYNSVHLKRSEFQCDQCSKSYSTKMALRNHIAQKHEGNYQGPPRDKICDICGKGFAISGVLKSHMRTHTGERPFQCELCPSAFGHQAALYTHNRLVHLKLKRKRAGKKNNDATDEEQKSSWEPAVPARLSY